MTDSMKPVKQAPFSGFAGFGGGLGTLSSAASDATYVDDVFSTFLYQGNGNNARSITNGIDLSGSGGLTWIKKRSGSDGNDLFDTERGAGYRIRTNNSNAQSAFGSSYLQSFNSDGFTIGTDGGINSSSHTYVSWSFRKAPGFFDVVTWTGNGTNRTIAHNLGSVPGFILVKRYSNTEDWTCYHRSLGATHYIQLNGTGTPGDLNLIFNDTEPTSSVFSIGTHDRVNTNGENYVAYLFAHDEQSFGTSSNESIIKCGSYTGSGTGGNFVNVGFEPQFLLIKNSSRSSTSWLVMDNMRGLPVQGGTTRPLYANDSIAETTQTNIAPKPTGFELEGNGSYSNLSGDTFIYMAIRRSHKPATAATEVFALDVGSSSSTIPTWDSNFVVDTAISFNPNSTADRYLSARLFDTRYLVPNTTAALANDGSQTWDSNVGWGKDYNANTQSYMFKRSPGYLDVATYTGTGSAKSVNHNLGETPTLMIIKNQDQTDSHVVYTTVIDGTMDYGYLNSDTGFGNSSSGLPTSSVFNISGGSQVNASGDEFVCFLFASLSGISKVSTYTGTGSNVDVDCGFTSGARLVLIKRTDDSGDWYVWDTLRGIGSGNDSYSILNTASAQVTGTDYIDPLNAGFTVTSSAPVGMNANGGKYLFLAIA